MKRIVMAMAALAMMVGCGGGEKPADNGLNLMKEENFKCEIDGKPVSLYTLTNGTLTMQVTNFGGRVVSLWLPSVHVTYSAPWAVSTITTNWPITPMPLRI